MRRSIAVLIVIVGLFSATTSAWAVVKNPGPIQDQGPPSPAGAYTDQTPQTAPPIPIAHSYTTTIAANMATVNAAPLAVRNEAASITTQAQYDAASKKAQKLFSLPTSTTSSVKVKSIAPPPPPAVTPNVGTSYVWPPACYWAKDTVATHNFLGWTLTTVNVQVNNWCWVYNLYGYWVIYSEPWWAWWVTTHWGWGTCGIVGQLAGWNDPPFQWGAAATFQFGRIVGLGSTYCFPDPSGQLSHTDEAGVWVYGYGRYDYL